MLKPRHRQILSRLNSRGAKHYCLLQGRNIVGSVGALINQKRLEFVVTKTQFGYFAAVKYDDAITSKWARTPSDAVISLGIHMKDIVR